ncbi:MAG: glycosyltransferase family 4 protein [Actinomycetia bacterium]|nr:glycosyltransferase family 4 protein [Actinomycetes bacterium]MCH9801026.1 glycosyltransferase family 4 protein [Actinomycetes bacterium]
MTAQIVITTNQLNLGGAEQQRIALANGLAARGHSVTMLVIQDPGMFADSLADGVNLEVQGWRSARAPDSGQDSVTVITGTTHTECAVGLRWRYLNLRDRCRWLVACHSSRSDGPNYGHRLGWMIRRSDRVIALSQGHWRELTAHQKLSSTAPLIVPNGVARESVQQPARQMVPGRPVRLVFVGRLVEEKGVQVAIAALTELEELSWEFDIYGQGDFESQLASCIPPHLSDRIVLRGSTQTPIAVMKEADLLLLPSRAEAQPMVLLEAMSAGTATMAVGVGAVPEILSGGCGVLMADQSVSAWREALRRAITNPEQLLELGQRGWKCGQKYSVDQMIDGYEQAIESAWRSD